MKFLKRVHAKNILKWGKTNEKAIVLSGDLTTSCEIDEFRNAYPERFLSLGLMEQNMMSFAAGLAREGLIPMVHTFSVFMYRRALDQIEMSIAYPNLPVKIFGLTCLNSFSQKRIVWVDNVPLCLSTRFNILATSPIVL